MKTKIFILVSSILITGCGAKFHKYDISYMRLGNPESVTLVDKRTQEEKNFYFGCGWAREKPYGQVGDENLKQDRVISLASSYDKLLIDEAKKHPIELYNFDILLFWPNDCARTIAWGQAAALSVVSYAAALAVGNDIPDEVDGDFMLCKISGATNGEQFSATATIRLIGPLYEETGPARFLGEMKKCIEKATKQSADQINKIASNKTLHADYGPDGPGR